MRSESEDACIVCEDGKCSVAIEVALCGQSELDTYERSGLPGFDADGNCAKCGSEQIDHGHQHVYKTDEHSERTLVIVYVCGLCGHEIFEESYKFECRDEDSCLAPANFVSDPN